MATFVREGGCSASSSFFSRLPWCGMMEELATLQRAERMVGFSFSFRCAKKKKEERRNPGTTEQLLDLLVLSLLPCNF